VFGYVSCTFKVNRGDEGRILFLIYELLKFITERGANLFIAEGFLIWGIYSFILIGRIINLQVQNQCTDRNCVPET